MPSLSTSTASCIKLRICLVKMRVVCGGGGGGWCWIGGPNEGFDPISTRTVISHRSDIQVNSFPCLSFITLTASFPSLPGQPVKISFSFVTIQPGIHIMLILFCSALPPPPLLYVASLSPSPLSLVFNCHSWMLRPLLEESDYCSHFQVHLPKRLFLF